MNQQKRKLRTSEDVLKRLRFDTSLDLPLHEVFIGYTDRTKEGAEEMAVSEFRMIKEGGDIPLHHVVYFRHGNLKLWDRKTRLDRFWGSGDTTPEQTLAAIRAAAPNKKKRKRKRRKKGASTNTSTVPTDADADVSEKKTKDNGSDRDRHLLAFTHVTPKIIANPRIEAATTEAQLNAGIRRVQYVYSFGMLGYRITVRGEVQFLLIREKNRKEFGFSKGRYEGHEPNHGFRTAIREFEEETGCQFNESQIVSCDWANPFIMAYQFRRNNTWKNKHTTIFLCQCHNTKCVPSIVRPKEIADVKWMNLDTACQRMRRDNAIQVIRQAYARIMQRHPELQQQKQKMARQMHVPPTNAYSSNAIGRHVQNGSQSHTSTHTHMKRRPVRNRDWTELSKSMSWILRHGAGRLNLQMNEEGYVSVTAMLNTRNMRQERASFEDICHVVQNDKKSRYSMIQDRNGGWLIRANQGHSLKNDGNIKLQSDALLRKLTIQEIRDRNWTNICHGTYWNCLDAIVSKGLNRMTRRHIHLSCQDRLNAHNVKSGMRSNCELLIYVDVPQCIADGFPFYVSSNDVILCEGNRTGSIPSKYFCRIATFRKGRADRLIWERSSRTPLHLAIQPFI